MSAPSPGPWRAALFLARTDLVHLLRQKETLLWTFLMPGLFFYFIGTVTGGSGFAPSGGDRPDPLTLVVPGLVQVDADPDAPRAGTGGVGEEDGAPRASVTDRPEAPPTGSTDADGPSALTLDPLLDQLHGRLTAESFAVRLAAEDPGVGRRLVLPTPPAPHATWSEALAAGAELDAVLHQARRGASADLDLLRVGRASYGLLLDLAVFELEGSAPVPASFDELAARPRALTVTTTRAGARPEPPLGYAQTIPGTMVMFTMLILLTSGSILLVIERREGLLRRLASTPIPRGAVLGGKWLARMGLAVVQLAFAMVLGVAAFDMDWGAQLPAVCALLLAWAAFNASLALLLANLVRTEGQMTGIAVLSSMVLAALGGCWWPIEITPTWMQSLAGLLPTGWAMGAMHDLVHFGRGPGAVVDELALLAGGALLLGLAGARSFRYR